MPRRRRRLAFALGVAWIVALTVGQHLGGDRLVVVPWLALGPLAASLFLTWRPTAVVAALATLAVAVLSADAGDLDRTMGVIRVLGAAALAVFAVLSSRVRVQREQRIRAVTEVATVAQTAILNPVPAQVAGLVLASRYVSASEHALVGGDL